MCVGGRSNPYNTGTRTVSSPMSKSVPVMLVLHAEARLKATTEGKRAINTCHEITLFFGTARHAFTWFCRIFA